MTLEEFSCDNFVGQARAGIQGDLAVVGICTTLTPRRRKHQSPSRTNTAKPRLVESYRRWVLLSPSASPVPHSIPESLRLRKIAADIAQ